VMSGLVQAGLEQARLEQADQERETERPAPVSLSLYGYSACPVTVHAQTVSVTEHAQTVTVRAVDD
jgi:hypothetical protein